MNARTQSIAIFRGIKKSYVFKNMTWLTAIGVDYNNRSKFLLICILDDLQKLEKQWTFRTSTMEKLLEFE